jgi:hypothetical protein
MLPASSSHENTQINPVQRISTQQSKFSKLRTLLARLASSHSRYLAVSGAASPNIFNARDDLQDKIKDNQQDLSTMVPDLAVMASELVRDLDPQVWVRSFLQGCQL